MLVLWNKPPNSPIPLSKKEINKQHSPIKEEQSKTKIATLLKSIDLSRLSETAFDNNKNIIELINIIFKDSNLYTSY